MLTVVCAVRNSRECVERLLESYRMQRSPATELVVVDALSTDGTTEFLRASRDVIDCLIVEGDDGIYDAWNKAVRASRGRYVSFIGADDRIAPGALRALCEAAQATPGADFIHGFNVQTVAGVPACLQGRPFVRARMQLNQMMAHVMAAHRRAWIIESGMFDTRFRSSGDYDFLLRSRETMIVHQVDAILAYVEDGGISRRAWWPFRETREARIRNGMSGALANLLYVRAVAGRLGRMLLGMRI
ncbi:MAG: glycosyltransferase [Candidatus Dactylopiibacterium sp.]|nr:glycosyltransferase [Candidatus Dactylopiibacterium sp.]